MELIRLVLLAPFATLKVIFDAVFITAAPLETEIDQLFAAIAVNGISRLEERIKALRDGRNQKPIKPPRFATTVIG